MDNEFVNLYIDKIFADLFEKQKELILLRTQVDSYLKKIEELTTALDAATVIPADPGTAEADLAVLRSDHNNLQNHSANVTNQNSILKSNLDSAWDEIHRLKQALQANEAVKELMDNAEVASSAKAKRVVKRKELENDNTF